MKGTKTIGDFEVRQRVKTFKLFREDAPRDLEIEIFETETGKFYAESNYYFWGMHNPAAPYIPGTKAYDTIEEALKNGIDSLNLHNKNLSSNEYCWSSATKKNHYVTPDGIVHNKKPFP